jgi:hypothetical protein
VYLYFPERGVAITTAVLVADATVVSEEEDGVEETSKTGLEED